MHGLISKAVFLAALFVVAGVTAEEQRGRGPTHENVAYGPHERNVLDLWLADSDRPTPLVVFIHGGGFVQGDKSSIHRNPAVRQCLSAGVSFASINYRFRDHAPIQDILRDAARAIQYLRSRASEWNLDPTRFAAYGGSAGAGTSLWLAFHDDLADPAAEDPVLRQSSRLSAAGSLNGQASYDLRDWKAIVGPSPFERGSAEMLAFYGFDSEAESQTPESKAIMHDCSMLDLISADDPPVAAACSLAVDESQTRGDYVHHPKHSIAIAERCKKHGVEALLLVRDPAEEGEERKRRDQQSHNEQATAVVRFLIEKLGGAK